MWKWESQETNESSIFQCKVQEPENEDIEREERIELNIIGILFIIKQFTKLNLSAKLMLTSETSMSKGEALSVWPFFTFHCEVFGPCGILPSDWGSFLYGRIFPIPWWALFSYLPSWRSNIYKDGIVLIITIHYWESVTRSADIGSKRRKSDQLTPHEAIWWWHPLWERDRSDKRRTEKTFKNTRKNPPRD